MEAILRGEGPYIGQRDILLIIRSVGFLGFLWFSFTNLVVIKILVVQIGDFIRIPLLFDRGEFYR